MILKTKNLYKAYGKQLLLKGVNLSIQSNQSIAIVGKSGVGKTTLLHLLGGLEEPDQGEITIQTTPLTHLNALELRREKIGFIFQFHNLLQDFTAIENVLMPARIARKLFDRKKGLDLLSKVGLKKKADSPIKYLSGGEKQRVAISRALCNSPQIILADEPTGNLDRTNRELVGEILLKLDTTLILATHDNDLAALCDEKYLLSDGNLIKS